MNTPIKFGTDGWRAVIADEFTFENVRRVAQAVALYWKAAAAKKGVAPRAVVGYDKRFLSEKFAATVAEVAAGNGIPMIYTAQATPTPAVSYAVKHENLIGGIMITASHNPPEFNGVKIKADFGGSADQEITKEIEALVDREPVKSVPFEQAKGQGMIVVSDVREMHSAAVRAFVDLERIAKADLNVVVDSMYGAGGRQIEDILSPHRVKVTTLHWEHNPLFGGVNPEPIAPNLRELSAYLKSHKADMGIVTDGDADRIGAMDPRGEFITTHYCFAMLLLHCIRHRKMTGCVVKALTTTGMVDRICAKHGIVCHETPVGFKWVAKYMLETDVMMGGEESGGLGFKGHIPERDGILAGLLLLEFLACERKSVNQIMTEMDAEYGACRYARVDMHFPLEKRQPLMAYAAKNPLKDLLGSPLAEVKDYDGVKMVAKDGAWLMLRGSGTEPILRVYAEANDQKRAEALVKLGQEMTTKV